MSEGKRLQKTPAQSFGDELGRLRYRARENQGMTQGEVGSRIGLSVVTIRNWESGRYRPSMLNLQALLEVYLVEGAFTPGKEALEIRDVWEKAEMAGLRAAIDEEWLTHLLSSNLTALPMASSPAKPATSLEEVRLSQNALAPGLETGLFETPEVVEAHTEDAQASEIFIRLEHASGLLLDQDRQHLLRRVYHSWIKGVLRESLYDLPPLLLKLREEPGSLAFLGRQESNRSASASLSDIQNVYDDADGKLLILGASGSGKSTLLLELASKLLLRAQYDSAHLIPVVFNLSSWSALNHSLTEWLVTELFERYQIPRKLGERWIRDDRLLLLLDGLDEGPAERIPQRITAINLYSRAHRRVPIVVCARRSDYLNQPERLQLHNAVVVQPLTADQIDEYLYRAGESLKGVKRILGEDQELRKLASSPRMLSILRLAYASGSREELPRTGSIEQRRERILALYLRSMLERQHISDIPYSQQQSRKWLTWLAQQLQRHNESVFYLEDLQIDWLPNWQRYLLYQPVGMGLFYGVVVGIIKALDYMLIFSSRHWPDALGRGFLDGALIGLVMALVYIVLNSWVFRPSLEQEESTLTRVKKTGLYGLIGGPIIGLCTGLLVDLPAGLVNALFFTIALMVLGRLRLKITPAEVLIWSWSSLKRHAWKLLLGGLALGLTYGLFTAVPYLSNPQQLVLYLLFGLSIGLAVGLLLGFLTGFSYGLLAGQDKLKPNQGIRNSLRNGLLLALVSGSIAGLLFGLLYWLPTIWIFGEGAHTLFPANRSLAFGLQDGLAIAAIFWLRGGGATFIQHALLRVLLWSQGYIPWRYTRFLDDASWRTILQKVGGGYIIHQLLLRHMAASIE